MKMRYLIIIGVIIVLLIVLIFLKKEKNIINIYKLSFSYSTGNYMNASVSYELICKDKCILSFKDDGVSYEDAKKYEVDKKILKEIEIILKQYHVARWNNFHKYDKNVLDGNSFSFSVSYGNNQEIEASGYMKWPKSYQEVKKKLSEIFDNYMRNEVYI